jgi:hypothetical protein
MVNKTVLSREGDFLLVVRDGGYEPRYIRISSIFSFQKVNSRNETNGVYIKYGYDSDITINCGESCDTLECLKNILNYRSMEKPKKGTRFESLIE